MSNETFKLHRVSEDHTTVFSLDRVYRYTLWRQVPPIFDFQDQRYKLWGSDFVQFIGLNPSTADEVEDDPTIRRCRYFAARFGFKWMCMTNLFAFRATDPSVMKAQAHPIGPANTNWIEAIAKEAGLVIAAWGVHGHFLDRDLQVAALVPNLHCLGKTKDGSPRHPLYLKNSATPMPYALLDPQAV
jgi:hypothetical protein